MQSEPVLKCWHMAMQYLVQTPDDSQMESCLGCIVNKLSLEVRIIGHDEKVCFQNGAAFKMAGGADWAVAVM